MVLLMVCVGVVVVPLVRIKGWCVGRRCVDVGVYRLSTLCKMPVVVAIRVGGGRGRWRLHGGRSTDMGRRV